MLIYLCNTIIFSIIAMIINIRYKDMDKTVNLKGVIANKLRMTKLYTLPSDALCELIDNSIDSFEKD